MKIRSKILMVILPVVACFAFLPGAQAQVCEDGCGSNFNTFQGDDALISVGDGAGNTAFGWRALFFTSATSFNTAVGGGALALNNSDDNVAVGAGAMLLNLSGADNTAVGTDALLNNDSGADNNAIGSFALFSNIGGTFNNAHGRDALFANLGDQNNAFGDLALESNTTGSFNTAMGDDALDSCTTGGSNVAVGDEAGTAVVAGSNIICIGAGVTGGGGPFQDFDNTCFIGSIFGEPTSDPGTQTAVYVDQFNVVGIFNSSRQYKHDIQPMDKSSETLYQLKPVTFKFNSDVKGSTQYGLIAEDVAQVDPQLVVRKNGETVTVRYEQINSMLLNEFLKEHKKVEEQQTSISQLKSEMQTMVAQLKEQAAQIQKVSAQVQVSKTAPQVVVNKP